MAMQPVALETGVRDGAGRQPTRWLRRPAIALGVVVLALAVAGDRSRAAMVPAGISGQDPLEVLELKVRPNVIVVLDSSGSMTGTVGREETSSGDHPRSRFYQAKQAVKSIVQNNQSKVSFQFGTYTEFGVTFRNQTTTPNGRRFQYWTTDQLSPSMLTNELSVQGAFDDTTLGRGLQTWQIIYDQWKTLHFEESNGALCAATLGGAFPRFYARGSTFAAELQAAMNAASCAKGNTYTVSYSGATGRFTFAASGPNQVRLLPASTPNNIQGALGGVNPAWSTTTNSLTPYRLLYRIVQAPADSSGFATTFKWNEPIGATTVTNYQLTAQRLWNGEVIRVQSDGRICGMDFAATKTNPPTLTLQLVATGCGADQADRVTFSYAGASYSASTDECRGFRSKSSLVPCDLQSPPAQLQMDMIGPYLDNELPIAATGDPADWTTNGAAPGSAGDSVPDGVPDYVETQDGTWSVQYVWMPPSAKTTGNTPIANSLIDIKGAADGSNSCLTNPPPLPGKFDSMAVPPTIGACVERGFTQLWNSGQSGSTAMAGPAPWQLSPIKLHGTCPDGTSGAAATCAPNERKPKEKTIVLFVTDGDDTCFTRTGGATGDPNALRAAYWAARLYQPIDASDPASSVQTYVIGYGNGASPRRLNLIAWGGSGLGQGTSGDPLFVANDGNQWTETTTSITAKRARCTSCSDAFIAPDAATLASQLQSIIDQGASDGDFNAQQSITETVFEFVNLASTTTTTYDAAMPSSRFNAIVPTRFIASFSLPGFKGQQKAFQNDGFGNSVLKWSAGDVLFNQVSSAMSTCDTSGQGGALGECLFADLHGGATDVSIGGSTAKIKRRIYTTSRNGVFAYTIDTLMDGTSASRLALWPPTAPGLMHTGISDNASKAFDTALGLPPDAPSSFPPNPVDDFCDPTDTVKLPKKPFDQCWFEWMQKKFGACTGNALPSACTGGSFATRMGAARRETREIAIAFMAGAAVVATEPPAPSGIKRATSPSGSLLFKARPWILGDSELATAAVVTPPLQAEPEPYRDEYRLFRDGPRASGVNADSAGLQVKMGFGLRNPDLDSSGGTGTADTARPGLKPVMTVLYAPANDMLHAFRAGPQVSPAMGGPCDPVDHDPECGSEELWGFIPFDQLHTVVLRPAHEPQGKNNHVFMLARGLRFSDIFVPGVYSRTVGGASLSSSLGAWRRILFFGRGIGGKYVTALDVTAPGPYTSKALDTTPPVPLWSRGNPDTQSGLAGGPANGTALEQTAYAKMGETWSMPTVAYVDKNNPIYKTARRPNGLDYVLFMGSGYGGLGEGTTFYTLDALSGDVIASVDVGSRAGFTAYPNALVANAVGFNPKIFDPLTTVHPAASKVTRVYIGDVHGRLWKFLTFRPDVALPVADLGSDQPVGAAVSLLGMPPQPLSPIPHIFVASGADKRAVGPFQMFGFIDNGSDTDPAIGAGSTNGTVTTFLPAEQLHARFFDQGPTPGSCGYTTEAVFRATVQPTTAFECGSGAGASCPSPVGRVFFAGTRLSLPNTVFAPLTPLACGTGVYPCRSQFDSTIYALGAVTGLAAYDLNATGDDAYRIFRDSRIAAITVQADPDPGRGGSSFTPDEGLMKGAPKPPPPVGVPPTSTTATTNVRMSREPGQPAPVVRFGTTVCQ